MTDLVERLDCLHVWPQSVADHYTDTLSPRQIKELYAIGEVATEAKSRIEALSTENEKLREELAAAYIKLSGKTIHTSDCATSNAPAMNPGPCDCQSPNDLTRAIEVELAMTALVNEDASSEWIDGFEHAWKRVNSVLKEHLSGA